MLVKYTYKCILNFLKIKSFEKYHVVLAVAAEFGPIMDKPWWEF